MCWIKRLRNIPTLHIFKPKASLELFCCLARKAKQLVTWTRCGYILEVRRLEHSKLKDTKRRRAISYPREIVWICTTGLLWSKARGDNEIFERYNLVYLPVNSIEPIHIPVFGCLYVYFCKILTSAATSHPREWVNPTVTPLLGCLLFRLL